MLIYHFFFLSCYIKGKQLWSSESCRNIWRKKIIKNIKIQLPAISMHVRLSQSLISMTIQKLYTNRSSFAQSARYSRPGASLSIMANFMQEKITLSLPYATGSRPSSLYLSFWNTNYQYQFIDLRKRAVFHRRLCRVKNMLAMYLICT
jgi:hypothetical protein